MCTGSWFNIPATNHGVNGRLLPKPVYGNSVLYLPVGSVLENFNKPRYVYTGLCCPLVANEKYILSFFISIKKIKFTNLALYFTHDEPTLNTIHKLDTASIITIAPNNFDADYRDEWKHVTYEYTARGNEKFFLFTTQGLPKIVYEMSEAMNKSGDVFYFIDEVLLKPKSNLAPCLTYELSVDKLFAQNYRHSENIKAFPDEIPKPVFKIKIDTIVISGLLFEVNKSNISKGVSKILDSLINQLNVIKINSINIIGHTDNTGDSIKNERLSYERANSIKEYLLTKLPELALKVQAFGKGQTMPRASNKILQGKQLNRRVEIIVTYSELVK
ncbi:MAG: OmpA family protein [Chitinophagaceae bacterium]|nr:OmpA family protein [Chitinophagaceae bacterium]